VFLLFFVPKSIIFSVKGGFFMTIQNLPERIKQERKRAGLTQAELAERLGISEMTVRRWESNNRSPRMEEIEKMVEILNTSMEYLMGFTNEKPLPPQPQESQLKQLLDSLSSLAASAPPKNLDNNMEGSNGDANDLGLAYWGGVLDNMRRLARSNPDQSDLTLIVPMLKSGIEELEEAKVNKNQSHGVVMNNYNGDNTVGTINMKGE